MIDIKEEDKKLKKYKKDVADNIGAFLQKEIGISFEEFTTKDKQFVLKKDLEVSFLTKDGPHYPVWTTTKIKKDSVIRIISPRHGYWNRMGSTNEVRIDFFTPQIVLECILCYLEHLVEALKE